MRVSELLDLAVGPAEVRGRVEEVYFSQNGFTAGCLRTEEGRRLRFAGAMLLSEQAPVLLRGRWEEHPKYGWQLRVESADLDLGIDPKGLANYLARHPALKGIGPKKARRLAERFGADFGRVLTEQPESVAQAVRVPLETVTRLREEWLRNQAVNAALTWLAGLGLTHRQVKALVDRYGNDVVAILKRDPYLIIKEVPGFGFRRADDLARQLGIAKAHPSRLQAALLHCVRERVEQGDCWVEYEELIELATALLLLGRSEGRELIEGCLANLIEEEALACVSYAGQFLVSLPSLRKMEEWLAEVFSRGGTPNAHFSHRPDLEALVDKEAPDLNPGQRQAVLLALRHQTCLVTGAAGSGKTHVSAALARIYTKARRKVALAAPTGKAAKRMEEIIGQEAFTLHRLLGYNGEEFKLNAEEPIDADVLLVDESSMMDVPLAWHLFQAINPKRTAVVLVGDHHQLPPVGPGNLLRDLVNLHLLPTAVLDQVVRQAGPLRENSMAVLQGEVRKTSTGGPGGPPPWIVIDHLTEARDVQRAVLDLHQRGIAERLGFDLITQVQVLTPTHKGLLGTVALNIELQRLLQKKLYGIEVPEVKPGRRPPFLLHDKVIQKRNNYELGIMNGSQGKVVWVDPKTGDLTVRFFNGEEREVEMCAKEGHLDDLHLCYAQTIHSGQGSEYPCVVLIVHRSHSFQHHRNLLYTGVTRAQEVVILLGDGWGLRTCAQRIKADQRKTFLSLHGLRD